MPNLSDTHNKGFLFTFTVYSERDWVDDNNELGFGAVVIASHQLDTATEMANEWLKKEYPNPKYEKASLPYKEAPKKAWIKKGITVRGFTFNRNFWASANSEAFVRFLQSTAVIVE